MDYLCKNDRFWDPELTWYNNTWPELTECFENIALTWIPCGYLMLALPFYILYLFNTRISRSKISNRLFVFKQSFTILMLGLLVVELSVSAQESSYFSDDILSFSSWIAIMVLHLFIVNLERTRDISRFAVLFVFWILGSSVLLIQLYSAIQREIYALNISHFIMLTARYIVSCVLFILHCLICQRRGILKEHISPYTTASLPSLLTFLWMEPMIFKGFLKPLQFKDLHNVSSNNTTLRVMNKFQRSWEKEKKRCKGLRERKTKKEKAIHLVDPSEIPLQTISENGKSKTQEERTERTDIRKPSFIIALIKNFFSEAACAQAGQLGKLANEAMNPLLLGFFIDFISNKELTWHGYVYVVIIFLLKSIATITTYPSNHAISMMSSRLQSSAMGSVFRKSLTIASQARKQSPTGEIINLMSSDSLNLRIFAEFSYWMWLGTVYFVIGLVLTTSIVGYAVLPGIGFMMLILVMNIFVMNNMRIYQDEIMVVKDERVKIMNEVLNGIKVIKLYGWEPMFIKKIYDIREKELKILMKSAIMEAIFNFVWRAAAFWKNFLVLVTFVLIDANHYMDANTAFVTLSYVGLIRLAINIVPIIVQDIIKANTSASRMNRFMNAQDISLANLERDTSDSLSVRITNADFAWEKQGKSILKGIDLEVKPGKLVAVVGTVGAGKSSLLSAMLGEMYKLKGYANLNSSVAYVPQQAWIQNNSIKENILFGTSFKSEWYEKVIKDCCLEADLKIMIAGDETEIGEKGINLSGGQKQRISLARAVYSQADIYLMDDPLSAVDSHVGRHIFDQVIGPQGCLHGKTRVLVTHGIQWLPEVDEIFVMTNGEISESGTFDELLAQNGDFSQFLTQYFVQHSALEDQHGDMDNDEFIKKGILQRLVSVTSDSDASEIKGSLEFQRFLSVEHHEESKKVGDSSSLLNHPDIRLSHASLHMISHEAEDLRIDDEDTSKKPDGSRLTTDEGAAGGLVDSKNYWYLWRGVGWPSIWVITSFVFGYHVIFNYANYWVAAWNDDSELSNFTELPANSTDRHDRNTHYIVIFTSIGIFQTVCVLVYSFTAQIRRISACRRLHTDLLDSIMKAPMSFFDTTPIGRILNRFSNDIEVIDTDIFFDFLDVVEHALKAIGILITISFTLPWFLIVVLPVVFLVYGVQRLFGVNACQIRRLASNLQSPIFAHFSETLSGASVIRAYRAQDRFTKDSNSKIDNYLKTLIGIRACTRWMLSRLDMVTYLVVGSVCIFAVVMRHDFTPGIIGLVVFYAFSISIELCLAVETMGFLQGRLVCVERVMEYSVIKNEAPWTKTEDSSLLPSSSDEWPFHGEIQFVDYSTRYRDGLDLVLKNINCTIIGGEKIGIVGRTGAGKSSMVLSLFRLIEAASGAIIIDGVDISHIGLHSLRHHITILPQDPVLFAGSLRMNLDPQEEKSDSDIWTALEHSHLKSFVMSLDKKLQHEVGESGENLSMGQRQLVCLARTLLRKTKILVLDEATAAVDMDTDNLIQKTIRTEFSHCTVITIAHRLNTIMDYDRIMVLDKGEISELDKPSVLLSDPESKFYSMAKDAGLVGKES